LGEIGYVDFPATASPVPYTSVFHPVSSYDFYNDTTFVVVAPKGTPIPIVKRLEDAFYKAFADQEYLDTLARIDHVPAFRNSEETRKFLEVAYEVNGKWIAELKIPKEFDSSKPLRLKGKGYGGGDMYVKLHVKFDRSETIK
jgi:hypothetical protein